MEIQSCKCFNWISLRNFGSIVIKINKYWTDFCLVLIDLFWSCRKIFLSILQFLVFAGKATQHWYSRRHERVVKGFISSLLRSLLSEKAPLESSLYSDWIVWGMARLQIGSIAATAAMIRISGTRPKRRSHA